jgi:hypothetical protein
MSKTEIFITKAKLIHGDRYDYGKVEYKNNEIKIKLICKEHGEFEQSPKSHLEGRGCNKCGINRIKKAITLSQDEFIKKAKEAHGDKYDYSKINYVNYKTKINIICPKHTEFSQTPKNHLDGQNCPTCASTSKITTDDFIKRAKEIHGNLYDYSNTLYVNTRTNLTITCNEHGDFSKRPLLHLAENGGCPKCCRQKK